MKHCFRVPVRQKVFSALKWWKANHGNMRWNMCIQLYTRCDTLMCMCALYWIVALWYMCKQHVYIYSTCSTISSCRWTTSVLLLQFMFYSLASTCLCLKTQRPISTNFKSLCPGMHTLDVHAYKTCAELCAWCLYMRPYCHMLLQDKKHITVVSLL